jgi:hypothetical protein
MKGGCRSGLVVLTRLTVRTLWTNHSASSVSVINLAMEEFLFSWLCSHIVLHEAETGKISRNGAHLFILPKLRSISGSGSNQNALQHRMGT